MYHRGSSRYARVIYDMKYARRPSLALSTLRGIADAPAFRDFTAGIDAVVPVPTTWWRRLVRGYNPAALLADEIARMLGGEKITSVVRKHAQELLDLSR